MTFLYLAMVTLTAGLLGFAGVASPFWTSIRPLARFLFAASLTPAVIGVTTTVYALVLFWTPTWIGGALPLAVSASLAAAAIRSRKGWRLPTAATASLGDLAWPLTGAVCVLTVIACALFIMARTAAHPVIANDALIYLAEALRFAEEHTLASLAHGDGEPGLLPPTHPHLPQYSLFLGHALWFTSDALGYPNDLPARWAFQSTVLFLVLAVGGLGAQIGGRFGCAVAIVGFFLFPTFYYMSSASSRDPFRLITLLAFIGLTLGLLEKREWPTREAIAAAAVGAAAVQGHTLGLYFLALASAVFLATALWRRVALRSLAWLAGAGSILGALAAWPYAARLASSQGLMGDGLNYLQFIGTPLFDAFRNDRNWGAEGLSFIPSVLVVLGEQGLAPAAVSLTLAVALIIGIGATALVRRSVSDVAVWTGVIASIFLVYLVVPLTDVLRFLPISLKEGYLSNPRYTYTVFVLAPVMLAGGCATVAGALPQRVGPTTLKIAGVGLLAIASAGSISTVLHWPHYSTPEVPLGLVADERRHCDLATQMPEDALWLVDRATLTYYCDRTHIFLYTPHGHPFFSRESVDDALRLLRESRVGMVSFSNGSPDWWPRTTLYAALEAGVRDGEFTREQLGYWTIYRSVALSVSDEVHQPPTEQ